MTDQNFSLLSLKRFPMLYI